jgi:hypothetical protein
MTNEATPEQKQLVLNILKLSGLLFIGLGIYTFFFPSTVGGFLDFDKSLTQILASSLIFVGISDIFVMQYLGKKL